VEELKMAAINMASGVLFIVSVCLMLIVVVLMSINDSLSNKLAIVGYVTVLVCPISCIVCLFTMHQEPYFEVQAKQVEVSNGILRALLVDKEGKKHYVTPSVFNSAHEGQDLFLKK